VRLFFAVELPDQIQAALGRLKQQDDNRDYRWSDASLLHVTLAFLGEQPPEQLPILEEVARAAARASQPGVLRLGTAGSFGGRRAPRVLWVGLEGDLEALSNLHANLDHELRRAQFPVEERAFKAHVTLARRRETARSGAPPGWPPVDAPSHARFALDKLTLFQSRLSPRGPTYIPLVQAPLGG
jgi:2'-5' RNA ligase